MRLNPVTLDDIEAMPDDMLNAEDIAPYLRCDPQDIRIQAHEDPHKLGFLVVVTGSRVKIPKQQFVYAMRYGHALIVTPPEVSTA